MPQSTLVTGSVFWPDGQLAVNALMDIYPNGYPFAGQANGSFRTRTERQGRYSLAHCGCSALGVTFEIPTPQMAGNGCLILMYDQNRHFTEPANPGEIINWRMYDMPCSRSYLTPDTLNEDLQLMREAPDTTTSGPWRAARQLLQ